MGVFPWKCNLQGHSRNFDYEIQYHFQLVTPNSSADFSSLYTHPEAVTSGFIGTSHWKRLLFLAF